VLPDGLLPDDLLPDDLLPDDLLQDELLLGLLRDEVPHELLRFVL